MNWDDLKIFLAVAEAPSMRHAAKSLKISHSTVSRRVESLESSLGTRLFDRVPDGYILTKAGQELLPVAIQMEASVHAFGRKLAGRDTDLKGELTITLPSSESNCLFSSAVLDFMQAYPDIQVSIIDSLDLLDLTKREADVAIRMTKNPPEHLIGRLIGTMYQAAYASEEYLQHHDPSAPDSKAQLIGWGPLNRKSNWFHEVCPFSHLDFRGYFKSIELQIRAAEAGLGIGFIPCAYISCGSNLVRITDPVPTMDIWLLSHPDLKASARVRVFRQFIRDRIPHIRALLAGEQSQSELAVA